MKIYFLIFCVFLSTGAFAQGIQTGKEDMLQKTSGEILKGKILRVTDNDITFVYAGETAEYVIKKIDVSKIVHSSGRVEDFAGNSTVQVRQKEPVSMVASPSEHHNRIAILPFTFLMDNQQGAEEIGIKAQQDAYAFLSQHSTGYNIIDPRTTNAALIQAGVTREKMIGFSMKNLGDILGTEYIIEGTISQAKGYMTSSTIGRNSATIKDDGGKIKETGISSSTSGSAQQYDVTVTLQIYMDNNVSIYNNSHKAFWPTTDGSYIAPLEYILKRCPLYTK
ncbi:hypothetical protein J2786_003640 [Chryseobacterium vietnamense]|uniref:Uncharacterized protein n=1 Tax=Chryseobacterium vietnamense TaxID=866785 RepID=A0ACC6JBN9_9FLAO|nr:hypothetical protein [Chryseobacterium vietnamense]MDR6460506.1 hypothetical protein [Chryseobacterium vietnamense]